MDESQKDTGYTMPKKYVICNRNGQNRGKSDSLLMVYHLLVHKYPQCVTRLDEGITYPEGKDLYAEFIIDSTKIALLTLGDNVKQHEDYLKEAVKFDADLILCASWRKGKTVDHVIDLRGYDYRIYWLLNPNTGDENPLPMEKSISIEAFLHEINSMVTNLFNIPIL